MLMLSDFSASGDRRAVSQRQFEQRLAKLFAGLQVNVRSVSGSSQSENGYDSYLAISKAGVTGTVPIVARSGGSSTGAFN